VRRPIPAPGSIAARIVWSAGLQEGEAFRREQLREHDLGERVADRVVRPRAAGPLAGADGDIAGQSGQHHARLGQAHLPAPAKTVRRD